MSFLPFSFFFRHFYLVLNGHDTPFFIRTSTNALTLELTSIHIFFFILFP